MKYRVEVVIRDYYTFYVDAENRYDAEDKALDELEYCLEPGATEVECWDVERCEDE